MAPVTRKGERIARAYAPDSPFGLAVAHVRAAGLSKDDAEALVSAGIHGPMPLRRVERLLGISRVTIARIERDALKECREEIEADE